MITDLIALAKQSGLYDDDQEPLPEHLQAFAEAVRKDEREACAVACEAVGEWPSLGPRHCADSIRARTTT